jgi:hypothetical protein
MGKDRTGLESRDAAAGAPPWAVALSWGEVGAAPGPCVPAAGLPVRRWMCGGGEPGRRRGPLVLARPAVGVEPGPAAGGAAAARSAGGGARRRRGRPAVERGSAARPAGGEKARAGGINERGLLVERAARGVIGLRFSGLSSTVPKCPTNLT